MSHDATADATVNAGDIARLADVGRAAVSNWRRRYDDFPQPVGGTASSPLFSLPEVEAWLRRNGKSFEVSLADRVWQRLRASADDLRLGEVLGHIGAFLLYMRRDPGGWKRLAGSPHLAVRLPQAIAAATPDLPARLTGSGLADPGLADPGLGRWGLADPGLMGLIADMAARHGMVETFEFLCERYVEVHSRRLAVTRNEVAALMTRLACAGAGSVLDPACGMGTLLLGAKLPGTNKLSETEATRLLGQDANETAAVLTALRLLLRGENARIVAGDALRHDGFPGERADAVVCDPPFNERAWGHEELVGDSRWDYGIPPRGESELAWVQHCLAHVRPGGLVAILMPGAAASRRPGRRIRANLLRAGALRAVVTLPAGGPDLWLLRRPEPGDRQPVTILVADAGDDLSFVEPAWQAYLAGTDLPRGSRTVRIIDILDDEVDVSPARHLSPRSDARGFPEARDRFRQASAALADGLPDLELLAEGALGCESPATTVAELAKAGLVTVHHSTLKAVPEVSERPGDSASLPQDTGAWASAEERQGNTGRRHGETENGRGDTRGGREAAEPRGKTRRAHGETAEPGDGSARLRVLTADDLAIGRPPSGWMSPVADLMQIRAGDVVASPLTARVINLGGAVLGPQLTVFRVDSAKIDPEFLAGFLRFAASGGRAHPISSRGVSSRGASSRVDARRARVPRLPLTRQRAYGRAFRQLLALEDGLREVAAAGETLARLGIEGLADGRLRPRG